MKHKTQKQGLREAHNDRLPGAHIERVFQVKDRWLALQHSTKYTGTATFACIAGRTS